MSVHSIFFAQEWFLQNPFSTTGSILDIEFSASGVGFAAGENGLLLYTDNFGDIWVEQESPLETPNRTVHIVKGGNDQVALVRGQKLIRTENGGSTWEWVQPVLSNITGIHSVDINIVYLTTIQNGVN